MRLVPILFLAAASICAQAMTILPIGTAATQKRFELRVAGVPATTNPFDPEKIALDAKVTRPDGTSFGTPAFFYQAYTRSLTDGKEALTPQGNPQWRIRLCPQKVGRYRVEVTVKVNGIAVAGPPAIAFDTAAGADAKGYVTGSGGPFVRTSLGQQLPLIGHSLCWHHEGGTYDYDGWLAKAANAGENSTRIWMCPWAFGLETDADSLCRYRLDRAWQLDTVLDKADRLGVYIQLCLDYHGMFEVNPDYWGGNNFWLKNPYNKANGGPCVDQKAFFTSYAARKLYKRRLRYLVARYGYCTRLLAWEFFNELDNVYAYLDPTAVASWYDEMSKYLQSKDPYHHLVTTSYVNPDRPEVWNVPGIDLVQIHPYGWGQPATSISARARGLATQFGKPVVTGEFGTDWRGWNRSTVDPYLRGFRQGIWGAALGSAGSAWSWWWENVDSENLYPYFKAVKRVLGPTRWGSAVTKPATLVVTGEIDALGSAIGGGTPFDALIDLDPSWQSNVTGEFALADSSQLARSTSCLNRFLQGTVHPDLVRPFRVAAWFGSGAKLTLHLNSVSDGSIMQVLVDGSEAFRWEIPNKDGGWTVNGEYDQDVDVPLPSGKHVVEVRNAGTDWFYLDWVRFSSVRPAQYHPSPVVVGQDIGSEVLVYCVNPAVNFPANATTADVPALQGASLTVVTGAAGTFKASWYRTVDGILIRTNTLTSTVDRVSLAVPPIKEDLMLRLTRQ